MPGADGSIHLHVWPIFLAKMALESTCSNEMTTLSAVDTKVVPGAVSCTPFMPQFRLLACKEGLQLLSFVGAFAALGLDWFFTSFGSSAFGFEALLDFGPRLLFTTLVRLTLCFRFFLETNQGSFSSSILEKLLHPIRQEGVDSQGNLILDDDLLLPVVVSLVVCCLLHQFVNQLVCFPAPPVLRPKFLTKCVQRQVRIDPGKLQPVRVLPQWLKDVF